LCEAENNNTAFADSLDFVERKERILIMKSDVMEKTLEQEHLRAVELTDNELEEVQGAIAVAAQNLALSGGFFSPSIALNQAAIATDGFGGF